MISVRLHFGGVLVSILELSFLLILRTFLRQLLFFAIISKGIFIGPDHLATMEGSTIEPFFELYINIACCLQEADMAS